MSRIFHVRHPVPHRFVPRRGRVVRFGYGEARTGVEVEEFGERPRIIGSVDAVLLHEADGALWRRAMALRPRARALGEADLRRSLEGGRGAADPDLEDIEAYLRRSPLCRVQGRGHHRGGEPGTGEFREHVWDGGPEAEAGVREFVRDRVRLHDGQVWLRYEGVVVHRIGIDGRVEFWVPRHPRIHPREGAWATPIGEDAGERRLDAGAPFPAWLCPDDDASWFVNALPTRLADRLAMVPYYAAEPEPIARTGAALAAFADPVSRLEQAARTASITGERVLPALLVLADALAAARDNHRALADVRGDSIDARDAASCGRALEVLRGRLMPRLVGGQPLAPEDGEALSALAP